ncbi:leucyl/phenylalanyl-tRNA--protein transferase [Parashewanella curva]|uniref:Leucyl/phenylalanyl-tRNA--protein transferase n=1 Tax=Parashewanella curva TaxID=2338552 RepID=A0A3L8PZV9_9GAMM|nr:leucyl/phenylalanyl-tRNA--protein transferase [Parashewanella curva]RLV60078.1 leucyl/phenylalanyl-tRNA--protein transferase [Parashewanella curva]
MQSLTFLSDETDNFPPVNCALEEPNGLLAVGGDLSPKRLLNAYYNGIFPWFNEDDPILWWSPNPRAIIVPSQLHISRSLAKFNRKHSWKITINHAFDQVIHQCAKLRANEQGTWITKTIEQAYIQLHRLGHAHSIEVWEDEILIGGLYGIKMGKVFCGESMFHTKTNASKIAMIALDKHLQDSGYELLDTQLMNPHLLSMGAKEISREDFIQLLSVLRDQNTIENCWQPAVLRE